MHTVMSMLARGSALLLCLVLAACGGKDEPAAGASTHDGGAKLPAAMDLLNDALVPDLNGGRFLTLFVAVIDTASGAVEWCNAGHNPPLLLRASDRTVGRLMPTGRVLGVLPGTAYRHGAEFVLAPGDTLLAYTDGVTEARGPGRSHFGEERLGATLAQSAGGTPAALLDRVRDAIRTHTGRSRNEDDLTMVAVRRSTGR